MMMFEIQYGKEQRTLEIDRHASFEDAKIKIGNAFTCPAANMLFQFIDLGNHHTYIETASEFGAFVLGPGTLLMKKAVQIKIKHRVLVENARLRIVDLPRHLEVLEKRVAKAKQMAEAELRAAKMGLPPPPPPPPPAASSLLTSRKRRKRAFRRN